MYCEQCGKKISKDSKFCPECGVKIESAEREKQVSTKKEAEKPVTVDKTNNQNNKSGLSIASLVLGIISIALGLFLNIFIIPIAVVGLVLGIVYKEKTKQMCTGIILNLIGLIVSILTFVLIIIFAISIVDLFEDIDDPDNYHINDNYDTITDYNDIDTYDSGNSRKYYNTKRIGSADYGYLSVNNNWHRFHDVDGNNTLQYSYANVWIISMYAVDSKTLDSNTYANNVKTKMESENATMITSTTSFVGNYKAYKVSGYYSDDNAWLMTWFFEASDGKTHYISIEGPDRYSENFDIINTFSLEK